MVSRIGDIRGKMKNQMSWFVVSVLLITFLSACGSFSGVGSDNGIRGPSFAPQFPSPATGEPTNTSPVLAETSPVVVRSRAVFVLTSDGSNIEVNALDSSLESRLVSRNQTSSIPVTVTNGPSTSMTLDTSLFIVPTTITTANLNFGSLKISNLSDNDLKHCGANKNQKCNTALIRMYTAGVAGAGLYNSEDSYGLPITAGQSTKAVVGLGPENAVILQSFTIPGEVHNVKLSNFTNPRYGVSIDFTNAGAGIYSTTIVVEYALAP